MPDIQHSKIKPVVVPPREPIQVNPSHRYVELFTTSNFSFLQGGSHPEELVTTAAELGYQGLALTDCNSLAGIVRAHGAATKIGFPFFVGCRLEFRVGAKDNSPSADFKLLWLLVYPTNRKAYGQLCNILTIGKRRSEKGSCELWLEDLLTLGEGLVVIAVPPTSISNSRHVEYVTAERFWEVANLLNLHLKAGQLFSVAVVKNQEAANRREIKELVHAASTNQIPLVATNDVYYHAPERRFLQDILTCIRHKTTIHEAGFLLLQNSERYLKPPAETARLFRELPQALSRTLQIKEALEGFSLDQLRYEYPDEICPEGIAPFEHLCDLTRKGALHRYPTGVPPKVSKLLHAELELIKELKYEKYFLTCHDIVQFARSRGILCQGRGAAANSAVCYCLEITAVDPAQIELLFARFVSKERNEPPDIDIDFEHERREEVIQYIYSKYGRRHAGLTAEVITYRHRSAIREVAKALGFAEATIDKLAKSIHRWSRYQIAEEELKNLGLDLSSAMVANVFRLSNELLGFPRHLSQHVGGFVITQHPLSETVPILNASMPDRTIIEWDKDDIEILGMLKIDVLGLGMLTCIRKALQLVNTTQKSKLELHTIPAKDAKTYDMICNADTVGVFQIESRAQMSMLPRLKPRSFYDLVIEVAIVRPGPIQGNMVHPYLRRRAGKEQVHFPDQRVRDVLGKTLGVPIFQEQAMRLAIVLANFDPGEAEQLRRAMAAWKRNKQQIVAFQTRIIAGMISNGYTQEFAESCVNQIKGFSEYGFPESHAASFALLVYASAWIKRHYPAHFAAALLNSQPMGFYAPAQIIADAQRHGVSVLPVDIGYSYWDHTLEDTDTSKPALRLGFRLVKSLAQAQAERIITARSAIEQISSLHTLWRSAFHTTNGLQRKTLELLANADAFGSLNLSRRTALWEIKALPKKPLPLNLKQTSKAPPLPELSQQQALFSDYASIGLSLKGHPLELIRDKLNLRSVSTAAVLRVGTRRDYPASVTVAGLALFRQKPGTAKGMTFITLEDETGMTNLIIAPPVYEKFRNIIIASAAILARGKLERIGKVIYVSANHIESLDDLLIGVDQKRLPLRSYSY